MLWRPPDLPQDPILPFSSKFSLQRPFSPSIALLLIPIFAHIYQALSHQDSYPIQARRLFDESSVRDLVSWNSLINGYVRRGGAFEALKLFREMEEEGVRPDKVTMIGVTSSCGKLEDLRRGREFHMYIEERGLTWTIPLANTFLDMYVKCGNLEAAHRLYDSMTKKTLVFYTTMIVRYAKRFRGKNPIIKNLALQFERDFTDESDPVGGIIGFGEGVGEGRVKNREV